jgi:hypothetical protein
MSPSGLTLALPVSPTAVRDPGADAGADVSAQGVRAESARLPQDDAVPEVATDGGPAG